VASPGTRLFTPLRDNNDIIFDTLDEVVRREKQGSARSKNHK
jgi:hypothetical protein